MKKIEFSREETRAIVAQLQGYFRDELDQSLGELPAQMLLDFLAETIGRQFYNRGLYDAQAVVAAKAEDISEAILGLERQ
jgi:uncharacterized protein (DUF2164 family)